MEADWDFRLSPLGEFLAFLASMVYTGNPAPVIWRKSMMKRFYLGLALTLLNAAFSIQAQEATIVPPENIVADGVPKVAAALGETAGRYSENRSAFPADWNPQRREMIIGTRFANTFQAHLVKMS